MARAEQARGLGQGRQSPTGLAAILAGCAAGESAAIEALRRWESGRVGAMLGRTLRDPMRAQAAFGRLIEDLATDAGAFRGADERAAEDWLFARARLAARSVGEADAGSPRLYAVPPPPAPTPPPERTAAPPVAPAPRPVPSDVQTRVVNTRMRPPAAPVPVDVPTPRRRRTRRTHWLTATVLVLAAAALGAGMALLALRWLAIEWPFAPLSPPVAVETAPEPAPPPPATEITPKPVPPPPNAPAAAPPPPPPSVAVDVGPPIAAREPPIIAEPQKPTPPPVPPPSPVLTARVVIHHGAGADSRAAAQLLATRLGDAGIAVVELREVGFVVAAASIRYYFDDDRKAADDLLALVGPVLASSGRAAPTTPISFTDYRPLPRRGTLEVWLPGD